MVRKEKKAIRKALYILIGNFFVFENQHCTFLTISKVISNSTSYSLNKVFVYGIYSLLILNI